MKQQRINFLPNTVSTISIVQECRIIGEIILQACDKGAVSSSQLPFQGIPRLYGSACVREKMHFEVEMGIELERLDIPNGTPTTGQAFISQWQTRACSKQRNGPRGKVLASKVDSPVLLANVPKMAVLNIANSPQATPTRGVSFIILKTVSGVCLAFVTSTRPQIATFYLSLSSSSTFSL